jgi:ACT domain-containing protein
MMMIVDMSKCNTTFDKVAANLSQIGEGMGVQVKCQLEDIFDKMHRI